MGREWAAQTGRALNANRTGIACSQLVEPVPGTAASRRCRPENAHCGDGEALGVYAPRAACLVADAGGLAGLGIKSYALSNTLEGSDAHLFLRRFAPSLASEGTAAILTTIGRSAAARAGAVGVGSIK